MLEFVLIDAKATRCIPLGIKVDDQNLLSIFSKGCGKIHCRRGFSYAALLVDDCESLGLLVWEVSFYIAIHKYLPCSTFLLWEDLLYLFHSDVLV